MYEDTINDLMNSGLIEKDDVVVACMDNVLKSALLFGAIGAAIASSKAKRYIIAANRNSIRIFDVEKKTGNYLGTCSTFKRMEVTDAVVKGYYITLVTTSGKFKYMSAKKFEGRSQKDDVERLSAFFKYNYKKAV